MILTKRCYRALLALLPCILAIPEPAYADQSCQLQKIASLDTQTDSQGEISVAAAINGHDANMRVDTGSVASAITRETADDLSISPGTSSREVIMFPNRVWTRLDTSVDTFALGPLIEHEFKLFVLPRDTTSPDISGFLGGDIMHHYDVEIDFVSGKLNFFSPDHCLGQTVYWTKDTPARIPLNTEKDWHVVAAAMLDGKPVTVIFDTGAYRSSMALEVAQKLFGWDEKNPPYKSLPSKRINGGSPVALYQYPFASLAFEGTQINNPDIILMPENRFDPRGRNDAKIVLGMNALRQLHLYIAYKEQMLYLTAAEAH